VATSGNGQLHTMQTASSSKIQIIGERVIIAGTGEVGLSQRFHQIVKDAWDGNEFSKGCLACTTGLAGKTVANFQQSGVPLRQQIGYGFAALMAAPFAKEIGLVEFGIGNFQPEVKAHPLHFVSAGSGQMLADPFLAFVDRIVWRQQLPTLADGKLGVLWALRHAIRLAPGGVGDPIQMATLTEVKGQAEAKMVGPDEQAEFEQHVAALEDGIKGVVGDLFKEPVAAPPPVPK
jgi:hypothetical protein